MGSYYSQLELRPQQNYDTGVTWTNVILDPAGTNLVVRRLQTLQ